MEKILSGAFVLYADKIYKRRRANLPIPLSNAINKDEPDTQELSDRNRAPQTGRLDYIPRFVAPSGTSHIINFGYDRIGLG